MKMIIVDNSKSLQKRIKKVLMNVDNSISIVQAFSCKEASVLFSSFHPEIVILDIDLPDGSGIDLLRKFKKDDPRANVIMFTNFSTSEFKRRCMELGADHFINKTNLKTLIYHISLLLTNSNF